MHIARVLTVSALALTASLGVASAQVFPEGRVYMFHSKAQGSCPALDWHVVIGPNNTLNGIIAWDDMKAIAHATGSLDPTARTFSMQVHEVGGQGRSATVDGTVRQDGWLVGNVKGQDVACTGITVQWFVPTTGGN
jgi:hypothetical protein